MGAIPPVPRSLEEPVPRSQARSKVQGIIDADRAEVEQAVIGGSERALARLLALAEADLRDRLEAMGPGDGSFTATDLEASLVQLRQVLGQVEPRMVEMLEANARRARELGCHSVTDVLEHFERQTRGSIRPLAIRAALALESTLLEKYRSSVERYGLQTIGKVRQELQKGVLVGETFREMRQRLTGERGKAGMLLENRGWAERIVRTEAMGAYAQGAQAEIVAQKHKRFPDLKRKLVETFDARTAPDSYTAHGEVRDVNEEFVDGKGRRYLTPPGRPNDRACIIPWRKVWEEDEAEGDWERERTPGEAAGLVAPERPAQGALDDE